jgi:hypothetical protein
MRDKCSKAYSDRDTVDLKTLGTNGIRDILQYGILRYGQSKFEDIMEALEERHSATEEPVNCDEWELRYKRTGEEGKRINVKGEGLGGGGGVRNSGNFL